MNLDATTINGKPVQILDRFLTSDDGEQRIAAITARGDHQQRWPIRTDVTISLPEEAIRGRVVASFRKIQTPNSAFFTIVRYENWRLVVLCYRCHLLNTWLGRAKSRPTALRQW